MLIFFALLLILLGASYAVFRYSRVQTWLVHRVSEYLSSKLQTEVRIKGVNIKLPKKIILEGVFIRDLHQDTLLCAHEIKVDIKGYSRVNNKVSLNKITLDKVYFNLKQYKGDTVRNLDFILNAFISSSSDTTTGKPMQIYSKELALLNARFNFINENDSPGGFGMNYSELRVTNINADIKDIKLINNTIFCKINNLSLKERCGFELQHFSTTAKLNATLLDCKNLQITTPQSHILIDALTFKYNRYTDYKDFNNKVRMEGLIKPSIVSMGDIAYFAPALEGIVNTVKISGDVSGTVARLKAKGLDIALGRSTRIKGNVNLTGLPNIDETYIDLDLDEIQSSKKDLETIPIPPFTEHKHLSLPDNIANLGVFRFKGKFNGFAQDFVAYGRLETEIGNVNADINLKYDPKVEASYSGHLSSEGFNLGKMWGNGAYFDKISLSVDLKGNGLSRQKINATVNGKLFSLGVYNYTYQNMELKSHIAKGLFNGSLGVKDQNVDLTFTGNVDITKAVPSFDFRANINKAHLAKLHLLDRDSSVNLSAIVIANFKGKNIDDIQGSATINDLSYTERGKSLKSKQIDIISTNENGFKEVKFNSEFVDATIKGNFLFGELPLSIMDIADHYINNMKLNIGRVISKTEQLDLLVDMKNLAPVTTIFASNYEIAKHTKIEGKLSSNKHDVSLVFTSDYLKIGNAFIKNASFKIGKVNEQLEIASNIRQLLLGDSLAVDSIYFKATTDKEDIPFVLSANKLSHSNNHFVLNGALAFVNNQQAKVLFNNADVLIEQNQWLLENKATFFIDSMKTIAVDGLTIYNEKQKIAFNGIYSLTPNPKAATDNNLLNILFEHVDIAKFNTLTKPKGYMLEGIIDGTAKVFSNKNTAQLAVDASIEIHKINVNGDSLGTATITSTWNTESHSVSSSLALVRGTAKILDVKGTYALNENNNINYSIVADKVYLQLFAKYIQDYISNPRGLVSCDIKLTGTAKDPQLQGKVKLQRTSFIVNYLNTQYSLSDEITINPTSIDFNDVVINDYKGNTGVLSGKMYHHNFKNIRFDVDLKVKNFQLLNTTPKQSDVYYGTAYGTGKIAFTGPTDNLVLDINIKTGRETQFFIPLESGGSVEESNFISFINTGTTKKEEKKLLLNKVKTNMDISGFTLNMALDVTNDAEVQLIFDSKIGDIIKARGTGNIKLAINTLGDFNMYGDYTIDKGDYLFTLQNIVNKRFIIKQGGTIHWNGNPADAEINLTAVYRLTASLQDLLQSTTPDDIEKYKRRVPVECKLYMTNKLLNPNIMFDINIPDIDNDPNIATQVHSILSNKENEVNNQVMSLLVLGSFRPPAGSTGTTSYASAGGSNGSELLSNQVSNLVSQLGKNFSKNVDLNVNYIPASATDANRIEAGASTQLFNDRVVLNGSVGRTSNQNTSTLIGDFDFEYKIIKDGRLRFKVFNKTVTNSFILYNNSPYTQGAGFTYREDFSTFRELMQHYFGKKQVQVAN